MKRLIVLLGYMGSGKSRVGQELAQRLNIPFTDLDQYLETRLQMGIPELFKSPGELFFRKKEHEFLRDLLEEETPRVISLGGGTPCYAGNMDLVKKATPNSFYLQHSIPSLAKRLESERDHRPLISHLRREELSEFIGKHLFERVPFYTKAAHSIPCDGKTPGEILVDIEKKLV